MEKYSTFSGADIIASIGTTELGTLQSISWSTSRAKGPIHVMNGSADPIAYGRGIRAIAGQLAFTNLDKEAFMTYANKANKDQMWISKHDIRATDDSILNANSTGLTTTDAFAAFNAAISGQDTTGGTSTSSQFRDKKSAQYADQVLPFDIHIAYNNEYGKQARKSLFGVEILNEGSGISIEDISLDTQYSFVARELSRMVTIGGVTSEER